MTGINRRNFIMASTSAGIIAGSGLALPSAIGQTSRSASRPDQAAKPLKLLILGGTGFIGPALVDAALARGHEMTIFNRGRTNSEMFPTLEKLEGDRDPKVGAGLKALEGRTWDAVIDTSGYIPRHVNASASLLAPNVNHYLFISSVSVYADESKHGITEADAVGTVEDETVEEVTGKTYGPLKALCEKAVTRAMNGRATNVRPGFIVGPLDRKMERFPAWVKRVATRDRIACPGAPGGRLQLIDSRDLAAFCIRAIEHKSTGEFNAVGLASPPTALQLVDGIAAGTGKSPKRSWIDEAFLAERDMSWSFVPWVPSSGDSSGFSSVSNARAVEAGMTYRSIEETARDTWKWLSARSAEENKQLDELLSKGTEDELLEAWKTRESSTG